MKIKNSNESVWFLNVSPKIYLAIEGGDVRVLIGTVGTCPAISDIHIVVQPLGAVIVLSALSSLASEFSLLSPQCPRRSRLIPSRRARRGQ